jgi:hypothetical protein
MGDKKSHGGKRATEGSGQRAWLEDLEAKTKDRVARASELAESALGPAAKAFGADPDVDPERFNAALEILASGTVAKGSEADAGLLEYVEPIIQRALKAGDVDPAAFAKMALDRVAVPDDAWIGSPMLTAAASKGTWEGD